MNLRIKTGQEPGDLSKYTKQELLEGKRKDPEGRRHGKSLKKYVRMNEKAVLKRRSKKQIENEILP